MVTEDQRILVREVVKMLRQRQWTLGLAESCTGGLLSASITQEPGVSDVFIGAIVAYANSVKENILQVPFGVLNKEGAVSRAVALEMARGARISLDAQVGVAVTGVAGPTGGTPQKPVGYVCFALCGPNFEVSFEEFFSGTRNEIQRASVHKALSELQHQLQKI